MDITQVRAKYPQYKDLSDKQLADALHAKFYSDLPIQDYYKRIGFAPEPAAVSKIKGLLPAPVADTLHQVADVPIGFQKGVMQGIRMVSDMFGANNAFSKSVKQNEEALANLMSAQAKNDQQEIARILKEAEDKGVLDQIKAGVKAFTVAPVDTLTSALGTAAPAIVAALGAKVLGAGALLTTGISMATGAGMGAGTIKGTIYEETKKALQEAGVPEPIAEERAQKAQEYGGQNLDQILAGAAIGGVAARGPLEKGAVRAIANRISKNVAAREAAESVSEKAAKGAATGRIRAGVAEALPEAGQAAQEQIAANIAQQREGLDVPTFRGAFSAATMEGIAGGGLGAAFGGGRPPVEQPAPGTLPGETPIEREERLKAEAEAAKAAAQPPAPPVPTTAPTPGETAPVAEAATPAEEPAAPPEVQVPAPAEEPAAPIEPPAAEAAPPVEEPKVRKVDEPPATGLQPADIEALGISKKQPIYRRMLGKDLEDPAQREAVLTDIESYLTRGNGTEESRTKLTEFKAKFAEPAAPIAPPAVMAPAGTAVTFETAKGSQYSLFDDGTTQRNKAPRPEHPGDQGVKERTARTIYVDGDASRLSAAGVENIKGARVIIDDDGTASLVWENPITGKLGASPSSAKIKFYNEPAVGRSPLELWGPTDVFGREGYSGMHAGNKIVKITPVTTPSAQPETPSVAEPQPEAGGAGVPVAGGPAAVSTAEGVGPEPDGVVSPVADVAGTAGGKGAEPTAVTPTVTPPKEKVLKGSVATRVEALGVNAAPGGVPDPKIIRSTLESINEPQMARAVLYYLGVDQDGNFLVGANNLPQTPSAQEAAQMAGIGENSGDRVKKVAKALGITGDARKRYQASQTDLLVTGKAVSEAGTGARLEAEESGLIADQEWYKPIASKGLKDANHTELARAVLLGQRFLSNEQSKANEPVFMALAQEAETRRRRPEFASAFRKQQESLASDVTGISRRGEESVFEEPTYEEDVAPGQEEAVDEGRDEGDIAELPVRPTPGTASPAITQAVTSGNTTRALQAIRETPDATPLDQLVAQRFLGLGQFVGLPKIQIRPASEVKGSGQYDPKTDTVSIADGQEDTHTVLHEVTHGFVHKLIRANEMGKRSDEGYRDLKTLYDFLNSKHPKLKDEYGMSSLTEFSSEAMSNPQFQKKLGTIEYKTRSAWSTFVTSVRKLLKLPAGKSSALTEAMAGVDSLLRVGREYQTKGPDIEAGTAAVLKPATEAAVQGVDVIGEQEAAKPMSGNPALKARINLANNMAGLMDAFTKWYGGDIRTAAGRLNPITLISRALDSDRISAEAQLIGGLKKLDGLIVASELTDKNGNPVLGADGKPLSYKNVVARIADAAKKAKKPFAEYLKSVDTALYGHREYNVRKNNELLEQQAQVLEAAGNKAEADKLREEIATLAIKDPKKLDALEAAFQQDDFIKGISADLDTIRFNFIDMLVETGRISKEAAQEWKDNEGYIPFKRVQDYTDAFDDAGSSRRGVGATRNIKKFKGSTRQSTSVVENFSSLLNWATGEAMRNDARNRALEDMVVMGAAKRGSAPATDSPGGVQQTYENGERKEYYVPDPMLMVGFGMQPYEMGRLTKALNKYGTRVLRAGVTTMPPFAIKQVFDDISRAYAYAGVKNNAALTKNILFNFPKNWANEIFKTELFKTTKGQVNVKDLRKLGIVATFDLSREGNIKDVMVEAGAKKEGLFNTILRVMEAGAKASDLSVRQAIYSQVLKETGDTAKAESAAREIINFSYQGAIKEVRFVASVVPFFNAYAQGMDKLATAAAGKVVGQTTGVARSMFYTRMTYLTAMGLAYALMMQDDEEYNKLPDHVRDTHWILPGVKIDDKPVGIPLAPDLGFFFKAIPERVVRYLKYQGTDEERAAIEVASELFVRGYDVFSPPNVTPQLIRPLLENLANYSFFLGRPLESQAQLQRRPFERYGVGTSDAMKVVAEWLEASANATGIDAFAVSPIKLENAVRGLLGTTGGIALSMADMMVNPDRTDRPLHQQLSAQLTGASAVLKNPVGTRYMDEIYNLEKKTEQVYNTYKSQLKTDPDKADRFLEDNIGMYEIRPAVQAVMEQIRALNKIAMEIDKDTTLSPEERRKEIDELRVEQNEIARVVFSLRKEARDIQMGR